MELTKWLRTHLADCLTIIILVHTTFFDLVGVTIGSIYIPLLFLLVFVLPGWHLVRALAARRVLQESPSPLFIWTLVPTLSIATSLVSGLVGVLLHIGPTLTVLTIGLAVVTVTSLQISHNQATTLSARIGKTDTLVFLVALVVPGLQFGFFPYFISPPYPFPYFPGWDVFAYAMIAGRIAAGDVRLPIANINPISQQLPIPIGFPLFASLLFTPNYPHADLVVVLLRIGAVIPASLGMLWVYLICKNVTNRTSVALVGAVLSYSFSGYNVIDTKWFLPASFSWVYCLAALYTIVVFRRRTREYLFALFILTAFFFHIYTALAVTGLTTIGLLGYRFSGSKHNAVAVFGRIYIVLGVCLLVLLSVADISFEFPGAGPAEGGILEIESKLTLLGRSLSPAIWILAIGTSLFVMIRLHAQVSPLIHWLYVSILAYLLPVSGFDRLLFWPATMAAIIAAKSVGDLTGRLTIRFNPKKTNRARIIATLLAGLVLISASYPILVPLNYTPAYYVTDSTLGTVRSNFSLSEFSAAEYLSIHPVAGHYLIISDPGFALVLGGLTGSDAVRLANVESVMITFQQILLLTKTSVYNSTISTMIEHELALFYNLGNYDGLLLAFSARTYYWLSFPGLITYAPVDSSYVDMQIKSNFVSSSLLMHVYSNSDVDLFYQPLST